MGTITPTDYRVEHLEFTQPFIDLTTNYIIPAPTTFFNLSSMLNPLQFPVLLFIENIFLTSLIDYFYTILDKVWICLIAAMFSVVAAFYFHNWFIVTNLSRLTSSSETRRHRHLDDYVLGVILRQGIILSVFFFMLLFRS